MRKICWVPHRSKREDFWDLRDDPSIRLHDASKKINSAINCNCGKGHFAPDLYPHFYLFRNNFG